MVAANNAQNLANSNTTTIDEDMVHCKTKVYASMRQIASFINLELFSFPSTTHKTIILEILMGNSIVRPYLPQYYLPPNETKVQNPLVQGLKVEI